MPCQHDYRLDSIDPAKHPGEPRTAYLACTLCQHRQARITTRTDDEINAELAALDGQ
jgi:hypothetical protein